MLCTKMVLRAAALLLVVQLAEPAVWIAKHPKKPQELAHKEGCYIKEINDVIPFGEETYPAGQCVRIACERQYIDYAGCGKVGAEPPCYETDVNPAQAYPDCCPVIKCDDINLVI